MNGSSSRKLVMEFWAGDEIESKVEVHIEGNVARGLEGLAAFLDGKGSSAGILNIIKRTPSVSVGAEGLESDVLGT